MKTPGHYLWKSCGRWRRVFGASASPRSCTKKLVMSPSSTAHGDQYDDKYVTFELLFQAAFWRTKFFGGGDSLEPARMYVEMS